MSLLRPGNRRRTFPLSVAFVALLAGCAGSELSPHSISEPNRVGDARHPVVRSMTGATIEITRRDGTVLRGRYLGTSRMSATDYTRHWSEVVASIPEGEARFPEPGAMLRLHLHRGPDRDVRFVGFSSRVLEVSDTTGKVEQIPFELFTEVRVGDSLSWTTPDLADASDAGRLPMFGVIRMRVGVGEIEVPADQVVDAEDRQGHELTTGLLVGLLVGTAIAVVAMVAALHSAFSGGIGW